MKRTDGLLPIQYECRSLLAPLRSICRVDLFSDRSSQVSFLEKRTSISEFAKDRLEEINAKYPSVDLMVATTYINLFCKDITEDNVNFGKIQSLFNDALEQLFEHFFSKQFPQQRWNSFLLEMVQNDALTAYTVVSSLTFGFSHNQPLEKAAIDLGFVNSMLMETTFDEQFSLASFDLAIEQAGINRSLKWIAVLTLIIAILAFIVSTYSVFFTPAEFQTSAKNFTENTGDSLSSSPMSPMRTPK